MKSSSKTVGIDFKSPKRYSVMLLRMSAMPRLIELKIEVTMGEEPAGRYC
jgi:hypothetical protein